MNVEKIVMDKVIRMKISVINLIITLKKLMIVFKILNQITKDNYISFVLSEQCENFTSFGIY